MHTQSQKKNYPKRFKKNNFLEVANIEEI